LRHKEREPSELVEIYHTLRTLNLAACRLLSGRIVKKLEMGSELSAKAVARSVDRVILQFASPP
jgi:hypothetical protein